MRDDIEFNIEFCGLIEKYPGLYDHCRSDYCNRNVQDKLWLEIGKRLNETAKDCKDRWQNIRGRYGKFKKMRSLPSGSENKTIKDYYLAPYLHFLDDFIKSRKTKSNLNNMDVGKNLNFADLNYEPETSFSPSIMQSSTELDSAGFPMPSPSPSPTGSVRIKTPSLKDVNRSAYEYFTQKKTQEKTTSPLDSDLAFLQSVLPDMKLMTPDQKRAFKIGILNLAERILNENSPVHSNVHPIMTSSTSHYQQAANQSRVAPLASSENPASTTSGICTQPAELMQHQNQAQYALPVSGQENLGTSTQHQAQKPSSSAEYKIPAQTYQLPNLPTFSTISPASVDLSPAAEYQIPARTYQSLPAFSTISPASKNSKLPYNDRTKEFSFDDII